MAGKYLIISTLMFSDKNPIILKMSCHGNVPKIIHPTHYWNVMLDV